jgi:branched-chain amino acid transport system substrate-binding protein
MCLSKALHTLGAISLILILCVGCAQQSTTSKKSRPSIKIGVSLSLSGVFADHGKAIERGYQLWVDTINKHGGLLGRYVQLDIIPDASDPEQVASNYERLINHDHVDLLFGPASTPLAIPALVVANHYGYPLLEGAGGGPSVFDRGLHNVFDVSVSDANVLTSFTQYILSLPLANRPKTAAYLFNDDFNTTPQVSHASELLQQGGIHTSYTFIYPVETSTYGPLADQVVQSGADIVVLGTRFPDIVAFIQTFKRRHYNPQAIIATGGPDQSDDFVKAIGLPSTEGVFVPKIWYPGANTYQNADMVKAYLAKYGGKADEISPDTAAAYAVGQVVEQAVNKIRAFDKATLIKELSTGTFYSIQGTVKFNNSGQNTAMQPYLFQWQKGALIPVYPSLVAVTHPEFPKSPWL